MNREELDALYFRALEVEESGDVAEALRLFRQGAALGDSGAQNAIGLAYDSGVNVEQDKDEAIAWFKKAWRTDKQSCYCSNIALTYAETGRRRQAMYWWQKAIELRDGDSALSLAKFLLKEKPVPVPNRIVDLLKVAAACEESLEITPDGKEQAEELLEMFTSRSPAEAKKS